MEPNPLGLNAQGLLNVHSQLALLSLPPQLRRRLLNNVAKRVRTMGRKRSREQQNLDGSPFAPRKGSAKGKKKMESGLAKLLEVTRLSADQAELGWRNGLTRWIAAQQHHGVSERRTAAQMRKANKTPPGIACTDKQAKRLRQLGFTVRMPGKKKPSKPSVAWIQANVNYAKAGLLIRILRDGNAPASGKQSWDIALPKRQILGVNAQETAALINQVLQQTLNSPH